MWGQHLHTGSTLTDSTTCTVNIYYIKETSIHNHDFDNYAIKTSENIYLQQIYRYCRIWYCTVLFHIYIFVKHHIVLHSINVRRFLFHFATFLYVLIHERTIFLSINKIRGTLTSLKCNTSVLDNLKTRKLFVC